MDYEYNTIEDAQKALAASIADTAADNPEVGEDDVAYEMVVAIAGFSRPDIAAELCRRELGWIPEHIVGATVV